MTKTEYAGNGGCPQRDSVEHKEYAEAYSTEARKINEKDGADLLCKVLSRENLNKAYKKVRANKGAAGIDGMTVEEALPWLKSNGDDLLDKIRSGKYKPQPVRRVEIPKDNGGKRLLGIPTVIDRINRFAEEQDVLLYNHIDTGTDLLNFISTCDNELKQFEEARKKLRTKLKSAENSGDEKLASELRSNISVVTQAMKKVRRDKKVCENIRDRAPEIAKKIRDVDAVNEKIRREKELEKTRAEKTTMHRSRYGYDR